MLLISLVVFLFSFASVSSADDDIDLSSLTTAELVAVRDAINKELAARNFAEIGVTVPIGEYTVGEDIPAGVYTIKSTDLCRVSVFADSSERYAGFSEYISGDDIIGKLTLENGQFVRIKMGSAVFSPYKGLGF